MPQLHAQSSDSELNTIAGTTIQIRVPVSIHHTWEMLEECLVEHLPLVGQIDTFPGEDSIYRVQGLWELCRALPPCLF